MTPFASQPSKIKHTSLFVILLAIMTVLAMYGVWTSNALACDDPYACNYDASSADDSAVCDYSCYGGCGSQMQCSDGSCSDYCPTCSEGTMQCPDGSCQVSCIEGCTDSSACNYDSGAAIDNGTCDYDCNGCTDSAACNYDASAQNDDGSCDYACLTGALRGEFTYYLCPDGVTTTSDPSSCPDSSNLCEDGLTLCSDGSCAQSCPLTYQCSNGSLVYNPAECELCAEGESRCADGSCAATCPATYVCTDGRVVLNQSECTVTCGAGEFCCQYTLACTPDENVAECTNPAETGQCNASLTTLYPDEVTIGSPLEGNIGCSYGDGGPVSSSSNPGGGPIYVWSCVGTMSSVSCTAEVSECPSEAPVYCYGECLTADQTCEEPVIPCPNAELCSAGGKVVLRPNLKVTPIINPGESCIVNWGNNAFGTNQGVIEQATTTTRCTFSNQDQTFATFDVSNMSAPTGWTVSNVLEDQSFVLRCFETNDPSWSDSSVGSCRLNTRTVEFN